MDKIICIVGPSGSGKTTVARELEEEGYNIIQSYTTRKPRFEGEWGHTFIKLGEDWGIVYVGEEPIGFEHLTQDEYIDKDDIIACKQLYGEHYFATKEQYQGKGTSIYVVDPDGARQVKENVTDADVVIIFLMCDEYIRGGRLHERFLSERKNDNYNIEVHNRIKKDREIFKTCKCDYAVDANRELSEVAESVIEIISNK